MDQENNQQSNKNQISTQPASEPMPMPQPTSSRTNIMAILSLVFTFVFSPLGIIFGAISLSQIKKTKEEGKGLAIAGLVTSSIIILLWVLWLVFVVIAAINVRSLVPIK